MAATSPKQRMLNAYRGLPNDRPAVAPEFWYYYPAKVLGVDMMQFAREVPFHLALKTTFEKFGCEGWGIVGLNVPCPDTTWSSSEHWQDDDTLLIESQVKTPHGTLRTSSCQPRHEPQWAVERPIKSLQTDLRAWEHLQFAGDVSAVDTTKLNRALREVGESYLLEAYLGVPFFDFYGSAREGGFEQAVMDLLENPELFADLQARYVQRQVSLVQAICPKSPVESFFIGCSWSCNSLLGPVLWRQWDKPVLAAVAAEVHRQGRLLHVHFHGKCMDSVAELAEIGVDCVCPFERPPGGDVEGLEGLQRVRRLLDGRTTMNGNVHTVQTLIRGGPDDVRREVHEIMTAFEGCPRLIVGTGDQVGGETPEENLHAMIEGVKGTS